MALAGGGLLASCTHELGCHEAKRMVGQVGTLNDSAFRSWHLETLARDQSTATIPCTRAGAGRAGNKVR